jgi:hypothetical protein
MSISRYVRRMKEKRREEGRGVVIWVEAGAVMTLPFWVPRFCLWARTAGTTLHFLMDQLPEC